MSGISFRNVWHTVTAFVLFLAASAISEIIAESGFFGLVNPEYAFLLYMVVLVLSCLVAGFLLDLLIPSWDFLETFFGAYFCAILAGFVLFMNGLLSMGTLIGVFILLVIMVLSSKAGNFLAEELKKNRQAEKLNKGQ